MLDTPTRWRPRRIKDTVSVIARLWGCECRLPFNLIAGSHGGSGGRLSDCNRLDSFVYVCVVKSVNAVTFLLCESVQCILCIQNTLNSIFYTD